MLSKVWETRLFVMQKIPMEFQRDLFLKLCKFEITSLLGKAIHRES